MPTLSLTPSVAVFPCPHCGQTINTSLTQCPFCSAHVDPTVADASAAETSRVSQACNDASYLKIMLGVLLPFAGLILFPFLGLMGMLGFVFIKYALPIMAVRWWMKYSRVTTTDPDFRTAKRTAILVSAASVAVLLFLRVHLFGLSL